MGHLKPHHELFVRVYFETGNAAEAYRRAFPKSKAEDAHKANGWRLVHGTKAPEVKRRIDELRARMIKKSDITIDRILTDLESAKDMAITQEKPADLVNAVMSQAKVVGLLKDRIEQTNVNFDSMDSASEIIEAVSREAGEEVALALANAMGLIKSTPDAKITPTDQPEADLGALEAPTKAVN